MMEKAEATHIVLLPSPGMGHVIPLAELAKHLLLYNNFSVTFISTASDSTPEAQKAIVDMLPMNINSIAFPPIDVHDLPADTKTEVRITVTVARALPSLRDVLNRLKSTGRAVVLIIDLFGTDAIDVAEEFSVPTYIFFGSNAMALTHLLYLPLLDATFTGEFRDLTEPVKLPGCIPVNGKDMIEPAQDRMSESYTCVLLHAERFKLAKGIVVNTFADLEPGPLRALREKEPGLPPVYPVGPLIRTNSTSYDSEFSECLKWLDEQPLGSVLFVSFGSGGTLSSEQLNELAFGLEMSEQRFLWVARSPQEKEASATFFSIESVEHPFEFLPKGFLSRTKGQGFVLPSWAPQIQVLSHGSTGGFLTHCGWNSTLESIVHGVPLIAWPLYAEQRMNAVLLTEHLKVALRPRARENGLIGREEIARVVKELMEGEEGKGVRNRMAEVKDSASEALGEEGSSTKFLSKLAREWKAVEV